MKDLEKVSASSLVAYWKNLSVGLIVMMALLVLSKLLPFYFSPIIGLIAAAALYTLLYNNKISSNSSCMLVPYAMFYCVIIYSFTSIILNVLDIWNFVKIPKELSFFNEPYMPSLLLDPICFIVMVVFYFRRNHLTICIDCKISRGLSVERGKLGEILSVETKKQIVNLIILFGLLTVIVWVYYFVWYYHNALVNNKDWYIFLWINVIAIFFDELYFLSRYYNLYLDLKENDELISEEELNDMTTKTYLRYYLICGNDVYMSPNVVQPGRTDSFAIDTPFVTKRNVNGIATGEVHNIIQRMTGINDGEIRFFYGRKSLDIAKHRILRYFYFVKGVPEDYMDMKVEGEWINFEMLKVIYNEQPSSMTKTLLTDISRMTTIILTQKIFDERGYRRMKLKSYLPTYDLNEVREKNYDFQDDKWLRIAMYNSDTKGFKFKKLKNRYLAKGRT